MFEKYKEEIKFGLLAVLVLAVVYAAYQYGQSVRDSYSTRTFTVEGKAKIVTPNDRGSFSATVRTEGGTDTAALQSQNSEKMNAVIAYLQERGVEEGDLETSEYALLPRYSNQICVAGQPCPPAQIIGYTVEQSVEVTVRNVAQAGELLSGVVAAGANSVTELQFRVDDNSEATDAARAEALQDAKNRAEALAQAADFRIGRLVTFYEVGQGMSEGYPLGVGGDSRSALEAKAVPDIEPGTEEKEVQLVVTYEIR